MSKTFEIEGQLKVINDIQTFDSGFSKREFVVEVEDGRFPQMIKFECVKDKTALTDGFDIGDAVKVAFDIRGNEFKDRYYVNLNAWKLEKLGSGGSQEAPADDYPPSTMAEPPAGYDDKDDIPF